MYLALICLFVHLGEWRVSDVLVTELKQNNEGTVTMPSSGFPHLKISAP